MGDPFAGLILGMIILTVILAIVIYRQFMMNPRRKDDPSLDDNPPQLEEHLPQPAPRPSEQTGTRGIPSKTIDAKTDASKGESQTQPTIVSADPVQFSAYYPKEAAPQTWYPLAAYVYRENFIDAIRADAKQQLGDKLTGYREVSEPASQPLAEGAVIKAEPRIEGFQFNPPSITIGFYEDWQRLDFRLRATDGVPLNIAANGELTFSVEGLIIADIPLSVFVTDQVQTQTDAQTATAKAYQAVFASYSRRDLHVVERVERAYRALGLDYLRDMITIRSGESWSDALETMIDRADVFQLFWSSNSAPSKHVQMEWEYALKHAQTRPKFIRPVYWEMPMPPVPEVLGHLHFAYEPELGDTTDKP